MTTTKFIKIDRVSSGIKHIAKKNEWSRNITFIRFEKKFGRMKKTNAARILDKQNMEYELVSYEVNEDDLSAITLARNLGQNIEQIFKTLVLRGNTSGIFVAVIPGYAEVNLKKAAKISGNKKAELVAIKELLPLTGYIRGGCSPLGMKKTYSIFIHESCTLHKFILISAGKRGLQIKLNPAELVQITNATVCDLIE